MRLRICRRPHRSIDGVAVDRFQVGFIYEVGTQVANVLLAEGCAEPVYATDGAVPQAGLRPEGAASRLTLFPLTLQGPSNWTFLIATSMAFAGRRRGIAPSDRRAYAPSDFIQRNFPSTSASRACLHTSGSTPQRRCTWL